MILSRQNQHIEILPSFYQSICHTVSMRRMYIVIHITCDKQQTAFIILCQINIGIHPELIRVLRTISIHAILDDSLILFHPVMNFDKTFIINIIVMISSRRHRRTIKIRISQQSRRRHKSTSGMTKNTHFFPIYKRITFC